MYAILDIETTGGQFNEEGITEIAIYRFDGHEITDQFISLVNPEIPIQPYVVKLTGISNQMLRTAPKFFEIAKRIIEITNDCVIVAHNASFDYRILRTEFRRLGYDFQARTLCTVELAQNLIPGQPAYSLGKLVRGLGIPVADRHRASGDALATLKLFELLLSKDTSKTIVKEHIKFEVEKGIAPKLTQLVEQLPSTTGVYYMYREDGMLLHVGRSRNIRKSVNQHFVANHPISKKITAEVFSVSFEETGSELLAMFKEREEIIINKPRYNRVSKRRKATPFYLGIDFTAEGYFRCYIRESENRHGGFFASYQEAKNVLLRLTSVFNLCPKINVLEESISACSSYPEKCSGACINKEPVEDYNKKAKSLEARLTLLAGNFALVDKGPKPSQRSVIVIEDGMVKGYTFVDLNYQISNKNILNNLLIQLPSAQHSFGIVKAYLLKNPRLKIVPL